MNNHDSRGRIILSKNNGSVDIKGNREIAEFAESLKPMVPLDVSIWWKYRPKELGLLDLVKMFEEGKMPEEVQEWFKEQDIVSVLANMMQFGYVVEEERVYLIKTPDNWGKKQKYYVIEHKNNDDEQYQVTTYPSSATKFERDKAKQVMKKLGIEWDLIWVGY
ncbi:DUF1642 domain-containing protein [Abiotrophia defectiva]|uniref:DUF1642 domain-containing protein n=1 Tax=Abiotrophia defectiva TaxID=46125 RepID=UPI0028D0E7A7|nr:DUF1642 domain-containing protein [Abiotrophia defectiva]